MSHYHANNEILRKSIDNLNITSPNWAAKHRDAWIGVGGDHHVEQPLALLVRATAQYADEYQLEFGSKVGDDGVLGEHWADIVRGLRGLLNGPLGRLDGGTMDKILLGMLQREGFEE